MQVTKPKKQRKRLFQAPDHMRYRQFSARLSPELRASHEAKAIPVRSGDTVRVMRGDSKGFEGKVTRVERKKYRIYLEGLRREKVDGTTISVPVHPSKVMITNLNIEDKWRRQILERKEVIHKTEEETRAVIPPERDISKRDQTEKDSKKKSKEKSPKGEKTVKRKPKKARSKRGQRKAEKMRGGE